MNRIIVSTILTLLTFESLGCICLHLTKRSQITRVIKDSDYIFIGTAKEINELDQGLQKDPLFRKFYLAQDETKSPYMTFLVSKAFKGTTKDETLTIQQDINTCTQIFKLNETYLIFGQKTSDGMIDTGICSSFYLDVKSKSIKKILRQLNKINDR